MAFQMYESQGSDAAGHVVRLSGARRPAGPSRGLWRRPWVVLTVEAARRSSYGRDEGMRETDQQRRLTYSSNRIESTATADRAVRKCVVSSSTNAATPTDTANVVSSNNICADQTSTQPRSIPALPIISCMVCAPCASACYAGPFQPARDLIQINRVIALLPSHCANDFFSAGHQIELVRSGSGGSLMPSPPSRRLQICDNFVIVADRLVWPHAARTAADATLGQARQQMITLHLRITARVSRWLHHFAMMNSIGETPIMLQQMLAHRHFAGGLLLTM